MRLHETLINLVAAATILASRPITAQPNVPEALEPWRDWVLHGQEFRACPVLNGYDANDVTSHICAWPGVLGMDVGSAGAEFDQSWTLYADDWVPLPGNADYWPADVAVDGGAQAVVARGGRPMLRLASGVHRITGSLSWITRPASIEIPREVGLVALRLDEQTIPLAEIEQGTLWLGLRPDAEIEEDRLDVVVYRRIVDSLPMRSNTAIELDVAGQSREVELSGALLAGFAGESLASDLPAQLDPNGTLRVQARPGRWQLLLTAHAPSQPEIITLADAADPWPADEVWSFEAQPRLRVAALEGAPAVDTQRTGVPPAWRELPSYRVDAGTALRIVERSRNDADDANRLTLARDLWLDFDGGGLTARDYVQGEMRTRWRLDMAPPYTMTMAAIDNENLLITEGLEPGLQGVELRSPRLAMASTARLEPSVSLPVTGYRETFEAVRTTLHVPPGYRLVAALGADRAGGSWLESWRLLDIFIVAIITVAAWRLFGAATGAIALAAIVLTFHEPSAPRWSWLNLLVAIALLRVAPVGRLKTFCRRYQFASIAAVLILLTPFTVGQLRTVVFPQLEQGVLGRGIASSSRVAAFASNVAAPQTLEGLLASGDGLAEDQRLREFRDQPAEPTVNAPGAAGGPDNLGGAVIDEVAVSGSRITPIARGVTRYLPGALVQTGPGLPDWTWTAHRLAFSGPVDADQPYTMVIFGPWSVAIWRVASVALALALLWALIGGLINLPPSMMGRAPRSGSSGAGQGSDGVSSASGGATRRGSTATGAASALLLMIAALFAPNAGHAQAGSEFPSPALLDELKTRLTEPAPCHPACAELTEAEVTLAEATLSVDLQFAVQDAVAVPVPTVPRGWRPSSIVVNGTAVRVLYRDAGETAWLRLTEGVHRVMLSGPLPVADSFTLPFPLPPRQIDVDAPGWEVAGVIDGRLRSGALELIRQQQDDGGDGELSATVFPPYVNVTRQIEFDLDWQVTTVVQRIAPADSAFTLEIDLLEDEAVITPGIEVDAGRASVAFAAGQSSIQWQSRLPTADNLTLTAPADASASPWSESWRFTVGHTWHAEYNGLPATPPQRSNPALFVPEYYPRPGESLTVDLARPEPVSGDTIAIDTVSYTRNVGARASQSVLVLTYRSTRGMDHSLTLPDSIELDSVTIDGQTLPLQLDGNQLSLPVTPGSHQASIAWRDAEGVQLRGALPTVDLGGGASNITTQLNLPDDRWVLLTFGPTLGPAILYWPELVVLALAAVILGRVALSPLRIHEWLLLGLGLSTFAWPVLGLFIVWAFALSWRRQAKLELSRRWFNTMQIGFGALTVVTLVTLVGAIPVGLLGSPDMQIVSPVQFASLSWFADRTAGATPVAGALSVSIWFYRAAMLAWALWLSFALITWLRWAWRAFSHTGIWRGRVHQEAAA